MALTPGLFSHTIATSFADARRDLEGTVVRDLAGKIRAGLFYNSPTQIITARPDMRLDIADFRAVLDRGGACFVANVGTAQSPAFTAAPSANKRIDSLILYQQIPALGDPGTVPIFEVVQGTASPTPVAPPLPANRADAIVLADVEIPAGATSMQSPGVIVTPRFQWTAMAGGTVYVRNSVEMAAWTPADGARVQNLSDNSEYVRASGLWVPKVQGETYVTVRMSAAANTSYSVDITFPRPFDRPPLVMVRAAGGDAVGMPVAVASDPTATGFKLSMSANVGRNLYGSWTAIRV